MQQERDKFVRKQKLALEKQCKQKKVWKTREPSGGDAVSEAATAVTTSAAASVETNDAPPSVDSLRIDDNTAIS